jgi:hypothetical protein
MRDHAIWYGYIQVQRAPEMSRCSLTTLILIVEIEESTSTHRRLGSMAVEKMTGGMVCIYAIGSSLKITLEAYELTSYEP